MPRGRPARTPSARNLALYYELVCEARTQRAVAARFGISQARVARVRACVGRWVERWLAALPPVPLPGPAEWSEAARGFHLAVHLEQLRLQEAYGEYLDHFGGLEGAARYEHLLQALDDGLVPQEAAAELPSRSLLASAVRMARELADLAEVARKAQLPQPRRDNANSAEAL